MSPRAGVCKGLVERGAHRRADSEDHLERGLFHHHRRDPRHHDLALSVLLAGLAGGRGPARRRQQAAAGREALRRATGIQPHPRRHHCRHGVLQPDRAVDHHHRRRHAACCRQDRYPELGAGRRGVAPDRRRIRGSGVRAWHRRHRVIGDPGARRRHRLCRGRGAAVAGGTGAQAEGGGGVLCRAGAVGRHRHRAQFHADQPDLGACTGARSSTACSPCP